MILIKNDYLRYHEPSLHFYERQQQTTAYSIYPARTVRLKWLAQSVKSEIRTRQIFAEEESKTSWKCHLWLANQTITHNAITHYN